MMEHVEQILRKLFTEIAEKHHYENCTLQLKAISSDGANYTSELYTATVSSLNKEDLPLFAKVLVIGEDLRAIVPDGVFDTEYFVYSELAEIFKQIEEENKVPKKDRYNFCKYYGHNPTQYEEVLVLENLAAKGFIVYDRMKSVDWLYASNAVKTLAKFHALSMAYGERYPEKIKELSENFSKLNAGFEAMLATCKKMVTVALKETKPENKERLAKFFSDPVNYDMNHYTKPRRKTVIIHGDYRPSNIMHKVNEDGTVQVVPLDFQTLRPGCIVADLLYFIFSSTDQEFRAQYYDQLVELYYHQLCRSLRALHFDPEETYSKKDFQAELKEILPYGLIVSVLLLPIITVEPKDAPDIHVDNLFESMSNTKTSSLYPDRLNGVVDDYVKWGII